jgi:putative transposase
LVERAWTTKTFAQYALHKLAYAECRQRVGLSVQLVVRLVAKVADAYKLDRKRQRIFSHRGGIAYDVRILKWSVNGRLNLPFDCGALEKGLLKTQCRESDLAFSRGRFYLAGVRSAEEE